MSLKDGMAAINLQMPDRIPHTEYSLDSHWAVINKVLGTAVTHQSSREEQDNVSNRFIKEWNYDFIWNVLIGSPIFGDKRTFMGHASYADGGVDYSDKLKTLYEDVEDAIKFDPWELYGKRDHATLVADFNKHFYAQCKDTPDAVNMTGIYVTGISGLLEVFGWDMLLMLAGTEPKTFGEIMTRYADWMKQYFEALADCNSEVVMIHDDIVWTEGAFLHPSWYREFLFPTYKRMFRPLIEKGKKIMYTSDGCYNEFVDDIAACGVNGFVMEPVTNMAYIAEKYGKTHSFIGNADTTVLLMGSKEDIYNEVKRCIDIGRNCPGFFMAVGNHIPSNTPVDNVLWYNDFYQKLSKR